jgi:ABC-type uncharacterized transport system permease subunit
MQVSAGVSNYIISVLQAFIIVFVAAPDIIRGVGKIFTRRRIKAG